MIMRAEFLEHDTADISAYQYDYGQKLEITGLELANGFEVHFQNGTGNPETRQGIVKNDVGIVAVPDITLSLPYDTKAWIYVKTPESGTTVKTVRINMIPREKPSDSPSVDDYPQIKAYADFVKENAERVAEAEAVADQLKADAAAGLFDGKQGPQGPPGTTDYRELFHNPLIPISTVTGDTRLVVFSDLDSGAYIFDTTDDINLNKVSYHPKIGDILYIFSIASNFKKAVLLNYEGLLLLDSRKDGYNRIDYDTVGQIDEMAQILIEISYWFAGLNSAKAGQLLAIKSLDMQNGILEFKGFDIEAYVAKQINSSLGVLESEIASINTLIDESGVLA